MGWCVEGINGTCRVGLEFLDGPSSAQTGHQIVPSDPLELDCYEIMQLSPNADLETIERVTECLPSAIIQTIAKPAAPKHSFDFPKRIGF